MREKEQRSRPPGERGGREGRNKRVKGSRGRARDCSLSFSLDLFGDVVRGGIPTGCASTGRWVTSVRKKVWKCANVGVARVQITVDLRETGIRQKKKLCTCLPRGCRARAVPPTGGLSAVRAPRSLFGLHGVKWQQLNAESPPLPSRACVSSSSLQDARNFTLDAWFHADALRAALQLIFWKQQLCWNYSLFYEGWQIRGFSTGAADSSSHLPGCPAARRTCLLLLL